MRLLFKSVFWLIILMPIALVGAFYFSVEKAPLVETRVKLTPTQVDRAKAVLDHHDPRDLRDGEVRTIKIGQRDLDLAVNYFIHLLGRGGSVVRLRDGSVTVQATTHLPKNPVGRYLNLDFGLYESEGVSHFDHLNIGRLPVPGWLANGLIQLGLEAFYKKTGQRLESGLVRRVAITTSSLSITYQWDSKITDVVRTTLVSAQDQERLKVYHQRLVDILSAGINPRSMVEILRPLLQLAAERTTGSDAAEENRAAIIVLTAYVAGGGLKRLAAQADTWPRAPKREVRLRGRQDFAQHFIISASLSMAGGNIFSDAIGLLKEIDDSHGGSGFSFNDLCADKAGTRFGEHATSYTRAGEIQMRVDRSLTEADIMPRVDDLPEHMPEAEFKRRFGGVDSARYNEVIAKIDRRVDQLPLYR